MKNLGYCEGDEIAINGQRFYSGNRSAYDDEYYIDVYGPDGYFITSVYNYDG